jgi:hypothetical protein
MYPMSEQMKSNLITLTIFNEKRAKDEWKCHYTHGNTQIEQKARIILIKLNVVKLRGEECLLFLALFSSRCLNKSSLIQSRSASYSQSNGK